MEALELVHAAQVAIDSLRGVPRPNPSNPHNVAAYNEWVRVAGVFYALFGYQIDPKTGLVVEDPDTANFSPGQKVCGKPTDLSVEHSVLASDLSLLSHSNSELSKDDGWKQRHESRPATPYQVFPSMQR